MISCNDISELICLADSEPSEGISIVPKPDVAEIAESGQASVSLRLGRWFLSLRHSSQLSFDVSGEKLDDGDEQRSAKSYFAPFGSKFILHPQRFVLASTLEWLNLPNSIGGYVTGKSTWGRRGLIVETAAGVHPGFRGCLTLELVNVGEVPLVIRPGMSICQVFFERVPGGKKASTGSLTGRRRPFLGPARRDRIFERILASHKRTRKIVLKQVANNSQESCQN